jgi:CheY-like chemotaxis protein
MNNFEIVDILIVEDNAQDAELTIRALQKNNLVNNLFVVEDGAEAIDFLFCEGKYASRNCQNVPKVVLLDLKLPKLSGLEVLKILKNDPRTALIPVVAVTSSQEEPDIKEAYQLGVNSYVVKPMDFGQFSAAVSQLGMYWLLVNKTLHS